MEVVVLKMTGRLYALHAMKVTTGTRNNVFSAELHILLVLSVLMMVLVLNAKVEPTSIQVFVLHVEPFVFPAKTVANASFALMEHS